MTQTLCLIGATAGALALGACTVNTTPAPVAAAPSPVVVEAVPSTPAPVVVQRVPDTSPILMQPTTGY